MWQKISRSDSMNIEIKSILFHSLQSIILRILYISSDSNISSLLSVVRNNLRSGKERGKNSWYKRWIQNWRISPTWLSRDSCFRRNDGNSGIQKRFASFNFHIFHSQHRFLFSLHEYFYAPKRAGRNNGESFAGMTGKVRKRFLHLFQQYFSIS